MKSFGLFVLSCLFLLSVPYTQAAVTCSSLTPLVNSGADAGAALTKCFNDANGKELQLPAGIFTLKSRAVMTGPIKVNGTSSTGGPCTTDSSSCTVLRGANDATSGDGIGVIYFAGSGVQVENIIFDGDRWHREGSPPASVCASGTNRPGMLANSSGLTNSSFRGVVFMNAICGSAFELAGISQNVVFDKITVASNGDNTKHNMWSDGLTIHDGVGLSLTNSTFVDSTDVQLVYGGCQNCKTTGNRFLHTADIRHSSFAAALIHGWPTTSGNFNGSEFSGNTFECNGNCGFGLGVGGRAWYVSPTYGGKVFNNTISGALVGINVDSLTSPMEFGSNTVVTMAKGKVGCENKKSMSPAAVNISASSLTFLSPESHANLRAAANAFGSTGITKQNSCIAAPRSSKVNMASTNDASTSAATSTDPVTPPASTAKSACTAAQPAPHWGMKKGQCLSSCGGLGGAASYSDSCSKHEMVDVGVAYDVPYCCKFPGGAVASSPLSVCGADQPAPHWGVKDGQCLKSCGALGGKVAANSSCSDQGLTDAGSAYDAKFCCIGSAIDQDFSLSKRH